MTTHISYECAKKLKEFMGESAPEPMKSEMGQIWIYDSECPDDGMLQGVSMSAGDYPAYCLHDLLSKPFCEAMANKEKYGFIRGQEMAGIISSAYYSAGIPAVEAELMKMMEAK